MPWSISTPRSPPALIPLAYFVLTSPPLLQFWSRINLCAYPRDQIPFSSSALSELAPVLPLERFFTSLVRLDSNLCIIYQLIMAIKPTWRGRLPQSTRIGCQKGAREHRVFPTLLFPPGMKFITIISLGVASYLGYSGRCVRLCDAYCGASHPVEPPFFAMFHYVASLPIVFDECFVIDLDGMGRLLSYKGQSTERYWFNPRPLPITYV